MSDEIDKIMPTNLFLFVEDDPYPHLSLYIVYGVF